MNADSNAPSRNGPAPIDHPDVRHGKVAVVLVNLGTPDAPTARSVRTYLAEFLADRRVVDYPRAFWMPVLHGVILNVRPAKTAALYAKIWHGSGRSPLLHYTEAQANGLQERLGNDARVTFAMRYGNPSIAKVVAELKADGFDRILTVPLYPQYSATTTATVVDRFGEVLSGMAWQPSLRTAPPFYDDPSYIDALAQSVRAHVTDDTERVILSFHGIPERYFRLGDPYHCHCQKTARLLRERMGWSEAFAPLGFQSKFGPEKWLEPSTESLVEKAAADGLKNIAIAAPAFVADCIETLEEIGIGLAETFKEAGGETLTAVPCVNDDLAFLDFLADFAQRELGGWIASG